MPLAGDAVTDTVAPGGRKPAWASTFESGSSSNRGATSRSRTAARARGSVTGTRATAQTSESGIDALRRAMKSSSASSTPGSIGGAS